MTNLKIASEAKCTVVVVGDSRTGKSALLQRYVNKTFQQNYMPTSFDKSFGQQEVNKHTVHFSFWDTSGSPAYDSVRPLSYQEADVFLLCYKVSDPISLYNVKNKWIRELKSHRPDVPVILCGCQADLRSDPSTLNHLSRTGRTPVSSDQALAICCEIKAVNYVETSAKQPLDKENNNEAFELCALAAIKNNNNSNTVNNNSSFVRDIGSMFKRSPSINSSLSLFEPYEGGFQRSPSTHSNLSVGATNLRMASRRQYHASIVAPPLNSPSSYSECDARLSTFSPEPLRFPEPRIPPVISENEAYQSDTNTSVVSFQTFQQQQQSTVKKQRPTSLCEPDITVTSGQKKLQRPTTLFKATSNNALFHQPLNQRNYMVNQSLFTPTGDPQRRLTNGQDHNTIARKFESLTDLGNGQQQPVMSAMIRPNCLTRRTSYRTYQKVPIPVAAPMSPVGSDYSFDIKSPTSSQCFSPVPRLGPVSETAELMSTNDSSSCNGNSVGIPVFDSPKTYESLKSQVSTTSSQNSSKASSSSSSSGSSSDASSLLSGKFRLLDGAVPDTENPELIKNLNFVSPKTGVYRPMPEGSRRHRQNCSIM